MSELKVYNDFSLGMNDTAAEDLLSDKELRKAYNVDYSERGGINTRKGTEKLNQTSFGYEVEQIIEWYVQGVTKKLLVMNNTLYLADDNYNLTQLLALNSSRIYYFFMKDKIYFTDGTEYYFIDTSFTVQTVTPDPAQDNDLTPIKKCKYFVWHPKSLRIFAAGNPDNPTALYFSEPNAPDYFKSTSIIYPTNSEGQITGLTNLSTSVLVSYNTSWWKWAGIDPTIDATWERLPIPVGCVSNDSIELTPNSFIFYSGDDLYLVNAAIIYENIVMLESKNMIINLTEKRMKNTMQNIKNKESVVAVFHNNKYMLAYRDDDTLTRNNKILVYDFANNAFSIDTGLQVNDFCKTINGNLLFASKNYVLKFDDVNYDIDVNTGNTKAIEFEIETKNYHLDYPLRNKFLRNVQFMFRQQPVSESKVDISIKSDYQTTTFTDVNLLESFAWGSAWSNKWGYIDVIQKYVMLGKIAKRFRINIKNTLNNNIVTLYALGFEFMPLKIGGDIVADEEVLLR